MIMMAGGTTSDGDSATFLVLDDRYPSSAPAHMYLAARRGGGEARGVTWSSRG